MVKNREKLYQAYHAVLSICLTWAFVLVLNQYFLLKVPVILSAALSIVPAILVYLFIVNRKKGISYLIIAAILTLLALILWIIKVNPINWMDGFIQWCEDYNGGSDQYKSYYAYFIIIMSSLAGAIICYLLMKREVTKICLAIVIIVMMFVLSINKINTGKEVVGISIFYILTIVVELYGMIYSKKAGRQDKKEGILYLAPICLALAILSISFPSKPEPIQWTFVKNTYKVLREKIEQLQMDLDYQFGGSSAYFNVAGFTDDDGELNSGNELEQNQKIALQTSGLGAGSQLYLIGSISDQYTGHSWKKSEEIKLQGYKDYYLDYLELFYALSRQDDNTIEKYRFIQKNRIKLVYGNIKTKTVFYPLKSAVVDNNKSYDISDESPQLSFSKRHGKGTNYDIDYIDLNLQGNAFRTMLREADSFNYDNIPSVSEKKAKRLDEYAITTGRMFEPQKMIDNYHKLKERESMIKEYYLQLPEELPYRVRELAQKITVKYDNSYDKLKALEVYLQQYTYSLKTDKVPKNQDFIDYFLFDGKKGYCTSFATAMAVMGRCIGIPTRYVEGFAAKMNEFSTDHYLIRNDSAHAWTEAYINGVGWIPFEATAPFASNRYTKWAEEVQLGGDSDKKPSDYYNQPQISVKPEKEAPITNDEVENDGAIKAGMIFLGIIFIVFVTILFYYNLLRLRYRQTFKKADDNKKMYLQFLRILRLLGKMGFVLEQQETIQMLAYRVKNHYDYEQVSFQGVANIYMRYRYAEASISKEEYKQVELFHDRLYATYQKEHKRYKLWIEEFLFLARGR